MLSHKSDNKASSPTSECFCFTDVQFQFFLLFFCLFTLLLFCFSDFHLSCVRSSARMYIFVSYVYISDYAEHGMQRSPDITYVHSIRRNSHFLCHSWPIHILSGPALRLTSDTLHTAKYNENDEYQSKNVILIPIFLCLHSYNFMYI